MPKIKYRTAKKYVGRRKNSNLARKNRKNEDIVDVETDQGDDSIAVADLGQEENNEDIDIQEHQDKTLKSAS